MIAALYVLKNGPYFGLPNVDPWDEARDARLYAGPWPVVAHPPCARWGRMAEGAFGKPGGKVGDDDGCFVAALRAVRRFGGLLEHPAYSRAWGAFLLPKPDAHGGWTLGCNGDASCCVEQGHYGHRTRKATWLYACLPEFPALRWGESTPKGYTKCLRKGEAFTRLSHRQRAATPPAFRDLLIAMAESVNERRLAVERINREGGA